MLLKTIHCKSGVFKVIKKMQPIVKLLKGDIVPYLHPAQAIHK